MITKSRSAAIFIFDLLVLYASFLGIFVYYNGLIPVSFKANMLMMLVGFMWFVIAFNSSTTSISIDSKILSTLKDTLIGYSVLSVSVIVAVAAFGNFGPNNKLILWPLFISLCLSMGIRFFCLVCAKHFVKEGYQQKHVLLVGGGRVAEKAINQILSSRHLGYRLYGVLADKYHESLPKGFYLGKQDRFCEIARAGPIDEVIVALPLRMEKEIMEVVEKCNQEGIRVRIVPDFFRLIRNRAVLDSLGDLPLLGIRTEPLSLLKNRVTKRAFDICFSLAVLVILSPFFLIIALLIKLTSRGPVFFKQDRVGANNIKFEIYKLRSMTVQARKESDTVWTTADDSRVTKIGRFIRKGNIDELPQFWNVLTGNMSVVGPRPEREHFVEQFKNDISHYKVRHLVKSGITGWAQVNGWRGDTSIEKRVECDIDYIENWSFQVDLKIIYLTLFGRETNRNAY